MVFQFQVWRYSGESRHLVQSICTLIFVIIFHLLIVDHLSNSLTLIDSNDQIQFWKNKYNERWIMNNKLTQDTIDQRFSMIQMWYERVYNFQYDAQIILGLMHLSWMYIMQHGFNVVFATKNKRFTHLVLIKINQQQINLFKRFERFCMLFHSAQIHKLVNFGNFLDFSAFLITLLYTFTYYKGYRLNTFLQSFQSWELGEIYWYNYMRSPINESAVLISFMVVLWLKIGYQFKLINLTGGIYAVLVKLFNQMLIYAVFYFSVLFIFSVIGVVLFNDMEEFRALHTTLFTMFKATIQEYDVDKMKDARVGAFLGYFYYLSFLILNIILIINLIVARLAHSYKIYNKDREILKLLATLSVREVSEADDKYSAVISAPFPLNIMNLVFGSIVISMKSQTANIVLLSIYYLPLSFVCITVFIVYQLIILPFCYFKIIGHKFALMVKSPQGIGARSTLDRAGQAIVFLICGLPLLALSTFVDIFWFIKHLCMMDLDKSHLQVQQTTNLNRRTYKKMIQYFEQKNEQLVPQKKVAEDLRDYLDVVEGIRCLVFGRPKKIPNDKVGLYVTYAQQYIQQAQGKKTQGFELMMEGLETKEDVVEQVVKEYEVVKQVLLNNSIPVDMREIQQNNVKRKGWGKRLLFDKKTFHALLLDLERMRNVLNLKKIISMEVFIIPYEGKPAQLTSWHLKVEQRITNTLKFLNTSRLLKIIGYDPIYHIKMENINFAMGNKIPVYEDQVHLNQIKVQVPHQFKSERKIVGEARQENLNQNMNFMLNKYQNSSRQIKEITDILKRLNTSNSQLYRDMVVPSDNKQQVNQENKNPNKNQVKKRSAYNYNEIDDGQRDSDQLIKKDSYIDHEILKLKNCIYKIQTENISNMINQKMEHT